MLVGLTWPARRPDTEIKFIIFIIIHSKIDIFIVTKGCFLYRTLYQKLSQDLSRLRQGKQCYKKFFCTYLLESFYKKAGYTKTNIFS